MLFFVLSEMATVNSMYQYSLAAYLEVCMRPLYGFVMMCRPSVRLSVCLSSVCNVCIVAKRYVVEGRRWQGRSDGGISVYIPPNQSTLNVFMWLFCLLDPFIPTQINFLATPLGDGTVG